MIFSFKESLVPRTNTKAISLCLYSSPKFDPKKHLEPLFKYLENPQLEYDILLFHSPDIIIPSHPLLRCFEMTSNNIGYSRHLWRYLGSRLSYSKIWFRGTDTIRIPSRELSLSELMLSKKLDCLLFPTVSSGKFYACTGRFCAKSSVLNSLNEYLTNIEDPEIDYWHYDEKQLSDWVSNNAFKFLIALDNNIKNKNDLRSWIIKCLETGNQTMIIKDRDDSTL